MKITVIQRKAGSRKELDRIPYEIGQVSTLRELLYAMCEVLYRRQFETEPKKVLDARDIQQQEASGKVVFEAYNTQKESLDSAKQRMLQDFMDGLFRVFIREKEVCELDAPINLADGDEVVWIRLVMLAGRLW